jgi:hypothetical protein
MKAAAYVRVSTARQAAVSMLRAMESEPGKIDFRRRRHGVRDLPAQDPLPLGDGRAGGGRVSGAEEKAQEGAA